MALSTSKILRKIGCKQLDLIRGEGYWYFSYTDQVDGKLVYDTHSVMEMYLGPDKYMSFWVAEGKEFAEKMKQSTIKA